MPDHTPIGADSLVIDMARRFATERLAPGAAAREKAGAIEPEIVARTRRARHLRRHHAGAVGRLGDRSGDLRAAAGGDRRRRRLGVHHGERAQLAHLHHLRPVRHRCAEGPLAAAVGHRRGGGLVRADRAAGGVGCVEPAHAGGAEGRPLRHQRRQAVHLVGQRAGEHGAVRGHRSVGRAQGHLVLRGGQGGAGLRGGAQGGEAGAEGVARPARWRSRTWRCRRTSASAPRAKATRSRCPRWRADGSASRRRASGWRGRRWTTRWSTPRSGRRSAGGSWISRRWGSGWSTPRRSWRRRGR